MARPKKPRLVDGIVLADNLYPDNKRRPGHFRYKRPDGKFKHFTAATVEEANDEAMAANLVRHIQPDSPHVHKDSLMFLVPIYVIYREKHDASLTEKDSWTNRRGALLGFAQHFSTVPVHLLTRAMIKAWWDALTFHQQRLRHAEFRKLFNWLMGEGLTDLEYNPFTTSDDRPRLYKKHQGDNARMRLTRELFWAIYDAAGDLGLEALQIAMGISLITFMRESDILALRLDTDLDGELLKKVVTKSLNQKGSARAARLKWDVGNHTLLKNLLNRSRELSLKNYRCPFVISHTPKVKKVGKTKSHVAQVTPRRLQEMFEEARNHTGLFDSLPEGVTPPTFHEIRSLADKLAVDAGYDIKDIQGVMAHEDDSTTMDYLDGHQLPFSPVDIVFTDEMIGGSF